MCSFLLMMDLQLAFWKAPKLRCPSTSATRLDSNRHVCVPMSWRGRCSNVVLLPKESAFQSSTNHFYLLTLDATYAVHRAAFSLHALWPRFAVL